MVFLGPAFPETVIFDSGAIDDNVDSTEMNQHSDGYAQSSRCRGDPRAITASGRPYTQNSFDSFLAWVQNITTPSEVDVPDPIGTLAALLPPVPDNLQISDQDIQLEQHWRRKSSDLFDNNGLQLVNTYNTGTTLPDPRHISGDSMREAAIPATGQVDYPQYPFVHNRAEPFTLPSSSRRAVRTLQLPSERRLVADERFRQRDSGSMRALLKSGLRGGFIGTKSHKRYKRRTYRARIWRRRVLVVTLPTHLVKVSCQKNNVAVIKKARPVWRRRVQRVSSPRNTRLRGRKLNARVEISSVSRVPARQKVLPLGLAQKEQSPARARDESSPLCTSKSDDAAPSGFLVRLDECRPSSLQLQPFITHLNFPHYCCTEALCDYACKSPEPIFLPNVEVLIATRLKLIMCYINVIGCIPEVGSTPEEYMELFVSAVVSWKEQHWWLLEAAAEEEHKGLPNDILRGRELFDDLMARMPRIGENMGLCVESLTNSLRHACEWLRRHTQLEALDDS